VALLSSQRNQATLKKDIALLFEKRNTPDFVDVSPPDAIPVWSLITCA